jgi:hypothetical protein
MDWLCKKEMFVVAGFSLLAFEAGCFLVGAASGRESNRT